jgi:hypothetical protein
MENLVLSCQPCNALKRDLEPEFFIRNTVFI